MATEDVRPEPGAGNISLGRVHRQGRILRTLRAHLSAHPDAAFTTDDLCALCYPEPIERRHRVAVRRALEQLAQSGEPPPHSYTVPSYGPGTMLVWYNPRSLASTTMALAKRRGVERPEHLIEAERWHAEQLMELDGTAEEKAALAKRRQAERDRLWAMIGRENISKAMIRARVAEAEAGQMLPASQKKVGQQQAESRHCMRPGNNKSEAQS
jgi:hypothetical protein